MDQLQAIAMPAAEFMGRSGWPSVAVEPCGYRAEPSISGSDFITLW
jgi:hypothetical protein